MEVVAWPGAECASGAGNQGIWDDLASIISSVIIETLDVIEETRLIIFLVV